MRKSIQISIPTPCHENWAEMTPVDKGRFCASCQKNVIDFTKVSDREIANALKADKNICGRFMPNQLERNLVIPKEKSTVWTAIAAGVISFVTLGSYKATAQEKMPIVQTDSKPEKHISSKKQKETFIIKVTVKDSSKVLENTVVTNFTKGTKTSLNKKGVYKIEASLNDEIYITHSGYVAERFLASNKKRFFILLQEIEPFPILGMVEIKD